MVVNSEIADEQIKLGILQVVIDEAFSQYNVLPGHILHIINFTRWQNDKINTLEQRISELEARINERHSSD